MDKQEQLTTIIRHIKRVEDNCNLIAKKIQGENFTLALKLIQQGRIHDASKLDMFEFFNLHKESKHFEYAKQIHHRGNRHHPEYWKDGIHEMPEQFIAEMVCDCVARSQDFGTDVRKWFYEEATLRYNFTMQDKCGQLIEKYLNLLLTEPFKK